MKVNRQINEYTMEQDIITYKNAVDIIKTAILQSNRNIWLSECSLLGSSCHLHSSLHDDVR